MRVKQFFKPALVFFFLLMTITYVMAAEGRKAKIGEWYLAKESSDISLFYRWIKTRDGDKTREMKAEFTINAEVPEILEQFLTAQNYLKWAAGIKKCEIDKQNDSLWYAHALMNYPWPLHNKDLVTKHFVKHDSDNVVLYIEAAPLFKPQTKGFERMKDYQGTWQFISNKNGTTSVEYRVISYQEPVLPRFLQDPVIQKITIDSFEELRTLAEAQ